jgi:hypothetical protein
MTTTSDGSVQGPSSGLERSIAIFLRPFGSVKPSEVAVAIVMMSTAFLLLTGYYDRPAGFPEKRTTRSPSRTTVSPSSSFATGT